MQTIVPFFYIPMHDVVPSVVAMAVRMVMAMCRIFCQMLVLFMVFLCYELLVFVFVFLHHRLTQIYLIFLSSRRPKGGRISSTSMWVFTCMPPRLFASL